MYPMSDIIQALNTTNEDSFPIDKFMEKIIGWKNVPKHKPGTKRSLAYRDYIDKRRFIIYKVNDELADMQDCRRLKILRDKRKSYVLWLNESEAIPDRIVRQFQRLYHTHNKTIQICNKFSQAQNTPEEQKLLLKKTKINARNQFWKESKKLIASMEVKRLPANGD